MKYDDQHRNTNKDDKDNLVGQLTTQYPAIICHQIGGGTQVFLYLTIIEESIIYQDKIFIRFPKFPEVSLL